MSENLDRDTLRMNELELASSCWKKVALHASHRIERYRQVTESPDLPDAERLKAAVRINELKQLLELALPASQPEPDDGD